VAYPEGFGFIGLYIVAPEHRGRDTGSASGGVRWATSPGATSAWTAWWSSSRTTGAPGSPWRTGTSGMRVAAALRAPVRVRCRCQKSRSRSWPRTIARGFPLRESASCGGGPEWSPVRGSPG
jgi:hypothetical protein